MPPSYLNFFLCSCFLSNPIVFWLAFFGPILAVILVNSMMFIIVIVISVRQKQRKLSREKKPVNFKTFIRPMISLAGIMILFGISWLFAALAIIGKEEIRKPNEVLFVFFNSLQGFFIFVFFCIINEEVRELWSKLLISSLCHSAFLNRILKLNKYTKDRYKNYHKNTSAGNISSLDSTQKNTLCIGTFSNNKKSSVAAPLELENTSVCLKNDSYIDPQEINIEREFNLNYVGYKDGSLRDGVEDLGDITITPNWKSG